MVVGVVAGSRVGCVMAVVMVGHVCLHVCLVVAEVYRSRMLVVGRVVVPVPW